MRGFVAKALMFVALMVVLGVAALVVGSQVQDRIYYREQAVASIGESHAGAQLLAGPVLRLMMRERYLEAETRGEGNAARRVNVERFRDVPIEVLPESLTLTTTLTVKPLWRGLFKVNTYDAKINVEGEWRRPSLGGDGDRRWLDDGRVQISLTDARGFEQVALETEGRRLDMRPAAIKANGLSTVEASIDKPLTLGDRITFRGVIALQGIDRLALLPLARQNHFVMAGDWPHPSFGGSSLPSQREVRDDGFGASWDISSLASEAPQLWSSGRAAGSTRVSSGAIELEPAAVSVRLIDPVDAYTLTDRATKYAMMFVVLTLASFALYELLGRLRIHPVQYLLVGVALLIFYLLLLSLSERVGFARAYLIASTADIALIVFYLASALGNWRRCLPFLAGLSILYGALYGLLHSEQNALLLGSLLLFGLLSALMIGTRKVDWFSLFASTPPKVGAATAP